MAMGWEPKSTWAELSAGVESPNKSYLYLHKDGRWWLDGPTGAGEYVAPAVEGNGVPQIGWTLLSGMEPLPTVTLVEGEGEL